MIPSLAVALSLVWAAPAPERLDHGAVLAKVRGTPLPGGRTIREAALAKVAAARESMGLPGKRCWEAEPTPVWFVNPAPKDAVGYLVAYRWGGFLCEGELPDQPHGVLEMRWIYDGKNVYAYGREGRLDPSIPPWKRRRPR